MNIELFARVYKAIEANPEKSHMKTYCGTTLCIAGWATVLEKGRKYNETEAFGNWDETAAVFLNIPFGLARTLFTANWTEFYGKKLKFFEPSANASEMLGAMRAFVKYYYPEQFEDFERLVSDSDTRVLNQDEKEAVEMLLSSSPVAQETVIEKILCTSK